MALPFWRDPTVIVSSSRRSAALRPTRLVPEPLRPHRQPRVLVRVQGGLFWSTPQILDGADYATTWAGLVADRPWYDDYVAKAGGRRIPLVRLAEPPPM